MLQGQSYWFLGLLNFDQVDMTWGLVQCTLLMPGLSMNMVLGSYRWTRLFMDKQTMSILACYLVSTHSHLHSLQGTLSGGWIMDDKDNGKEERLASLHLEANQVCEIVMMSGMVKKGHRKDRLH